MSNRKLRGMPAVLLVGAFFIAPIWPVHPAVASVAATTTSPATQPAKQFAITDFGALADGKTLDTAFIQKAIDSAAASGGTVVVPGGTFLSGSIFLKPGVGLEVDGVLKGSTNPADYPMVPTRIEGHSTTWLAALVNADGVDHLRISGTGTLDGSGAVFYDAFHARHTADAATKNLDVPRPRMVYVANCADVRIEGLHFLNSGFWNLQIYRSHDVLIEGIDIQAPGNSPSTDGIDIDSSQNVTIHRCRIQNNDDGIALKGSKGPTAMDEKDNPPVEHIHIYECDFDRSGTMLTCGSEATVVRDVEVDHCKAVGTGPHTMLRLKLRTDTPQLYEDIHFHDITLLGKGAILEVAPWSQYANLMGHAAPTHKVQDVTLSNITGSFGSFGSVKTNHGDVIQNLTLENIDVQLTRAVPGLNGVTGLTVKNVKLNGKEYTGPIQ